MHSLEYFRKRIQKMYTKNPREASQFLSILPRVLKTYHFHLISHISTVHYFLTWQDIILKCFFNYFLIFSLHVIKLNQSLCIFQHNFNILVLPRKIFFHTFNIKNRFSRNESSTTLNSKFWFVNNSDILFWKSLGKGWQIYLIINMLCSKQHQSYQF